MHFFKKFPTTNEISWLLTKLVYIFTLNFALIWCIHIYFALFYTQLCLPIMNEYANKTCK